MKTYLRSFAIAVLIAVIGCGSVYAREVAETKAVTVYLDEVPWFISTKAETVRDLLDEIDDTIVLSYYLGGDTKTWQPIESKMDIQLISITEKTTSTIIEQPFETVIKENPDLPIGTTNVLQEGRIGKVAKVERQVFHGEKLEYNHIVSEQVIQTAIDEIIEEGTQDVVEGYNFTHSLEMRVTAYTPFDPGCTGITATGTTARHGVVAVDPSVIPLGTKVYVSGYGIAIAEDTGGAIKGNRLDVCFSSREAALEWGVRNVTVYIIADDDMMETLVSNGLMDNGLMTDESILDELVAADSILDNEVIEVFHEISDDVIPLEDELQALFS